MLYFLDTGKKGCIKKTNGCIKKDQFDWLRNESKTYQEKYKKDNPIPAIEFHHIPSVELLDFYNDPKANCHFSYKDEHVCCSYNELNFTSIIEETGIKASFNGHDHKNMIECEKLNYTIGYVPKIGDCSYGDPRGYRVIKLTTDPKKEFPNYRVLYRSEHLVMWTHLFDTNGKDLSDSIENYPRTNTDTNCSDGVVGEKAEQNRFAEEMIKKRDYKNL